MRVDGVEWVASRDELVRRERTGWHTTNAVRCGQWCVGEVCQGWCARATSDYDPYPMRRYLAILEPYAG